MVSPHLILRSVSSVRCSRLTSLSRASSSRSSAKTLRSAPLSAWLNSCGSARKRSQPCAPATLA
eukprot:2554184-Heterocapsa_arctica.AAC.1